MTTPDPVPPVDSVLDLADTAIVVVNYGSHRLLAENLVPMTIKTPSALIVIVDNFSSAAELVAVKTMCEAQGWMLVALDSNHGFGAGVNAGIAAALADRRVYFVVLNPDASIGESSLRRLVDSVRHDPLSMVAPLIRRSDGRMWFSGSDVLLDEGRMANPRTRASRPATPYREWISGACFVISATLWSRIGGFDGDYFLYWEDVDLSYRVVENGGSIRIDGTSSAVHDAGGTHTERTRGRAKSETYYYYNIRNRLVYAAKTLDPAQRRAWDRATLRVSYEILLRGGRVQFLRPVAPVRALIRGIRDGRRLAKTIRDK